MNFPGYLLKTWKKINSKMIPIVLECKNIPKNQWPVAYSDRNPQE